MLPLEVAGGKYFHGRDIIVAVQYFSECTYLWLWRCTIGKLGKVDRTIPDPRWVSKIPCPSPKGEGREFSDNPPRIRDCPCQPHLVLLLLYP